MSLLLDHFDQLVDTLNSVPKLRQFILQLAVMGKLVPQDPNDEPASELLKQIKAEKEKLIAEGKIKQTKPLPPIKPEEIPYELPEGWEWVRLPDVYYNFGQKKPETKFTYIDVSSINNINGQIIDNLQIVEPESAPSRARKIVTNGSVIYSTVRPYLQNIAIVNQDFEYEPIASTAFVIMHPYLGMNNRYLYFFLRSVVFNKYVESKMIGVAYPAINDTQFKMGFLPLPPTNEQKRIVARVDQLMAQCNQLEVRQQQQRKTLISLNNAALDKLLTAETNEAFQPAWSLLHDRFDVLYNTPENIAKLRGAILQLAVMGKLVPHNPNDEPASELLKQIKAEKEKLIAEGKIKKGKPLPPIKAEEIPYKLPEGWEWVRLGELGLVKGGKRVPKGYQLLTTPTEHIYIRVKDMKNHSIIDTDLRFIDDKVYEMIKNYIISKDDIYITIAGTIGYIGEVPEQYHNMNLTENAAKLSIFCGIKRYFMNALSAELVQEQFSSKVNQQAQPKLALKRIQSTIFPLPPLNEQKRIVTKVNQFMALCDRLEQQVTKAQSKGERLFNSVVQEMVG